MVDADAVACTWPRSIDSPQLPTSGVLRESEGHPQRIRRGQLADQGTHVRRYAWTPRAASAFPGPEQSKTASMPRHDRFRNDDVCGRAPTAPGVRERGPQETVGRRQAKTRAPRSIDDGQLVSERDDFQVQRGARPDDKSERVEQRNDDRRHDVRLSENARNLNRRNVYRVLSSHTALISHR